MLAVVDDRIVGGLEMGVLDCTLLEYMWCCSLCGSSVFCATVDFTMAVPDLTTEDGRNQAIAMLGPDFQGLLERKEVSGLMQGMLCSETRPQT